LDDFTNHSCEPNCGLRVDPSGFEMIALRDITANEELTYDYSTHQEHSEDHGLQLCFSLVPRDHRQLFRARPGAPQALHPIGHRRCFAAAEASRAVSG
jgi:SET domain-containing protein